MDGKTNRREFLGTSALIALGAVAATQIPFGVVQAQDTDWVATLGKVKDLNEKDPVLVKAQFKDTDGNVVGEDKLFVRWQKAGKSGHWVVLSSICTHLKCKVEFDSAEDKFHCPCHGSEYDLDGAVLKKPAKKDLTDYSEDVYEKDGLLMLKRTPQ
jgi:cytochrome b6-f complex iron-sulfur subunit